MREYEEAQMKPNKWVARLLRIIACIITFQYIGTWIGSQLGYKYAGELIGIGIGALILDLLAWRVQRRIKEGISIKSALLVGLLLSLSQGKVAAEESLALHPVIAQPKEIYAGQTELCNARQFDTALPSPQQRCISH